MIYEPRGYFYRGVVPKRPVEEGTKEGPTDRSLTESDPFGKEERVW